MQKIIFVKKILEDGRPCPKCIEVQDRLTQEGLMDRLDEVLTADVRDPQSPGILLAQSLEVTRAPFFVVEHSDGRQEVHTIFIKFLREVLQAEPQA